jgi:hypothetical protein
MTDDEIKEIRKKSKLMLTLYDEVRNNENAEEEYIKALYEKKIADDANREIFLKENSLLTGYSLEFRNIYGIEPMGVYKIGKYKAEYIDSDGLIKEEEYYDSPELVSGGNLEENSLFFIDNRKTEAESFYHTPCNPPAFRGWTGDKIYKGLSRRFYNTEYNIYNTIEQLYLTTEGVSTNFVRLTDKKYSHYSPAKFYTDNNGNILCDIYTITPNVSSLDKETNGGGEYSYEISSTPSVPRSAVSYSIPSGFIVNVGDLLPMRLVIERTNQVLNNGLVGIVKVLEINGSTMLLDLVSYKGPLRSPLRSYRALVWKKGKRWWQRWLSFVTKYDKQPFYVEVAPTTELKKSTDLLNDILYEYERNYIDNILYYLNMIYNKTDTTMHSISLLNTVKEAFNSYRANSITTLQLLNAIKARLMDSTLYGSSFTDVSPAYIPPRANEINSFMKTTDSFYKVYATIDARLNKRTGSLREYIKYQQNTVEGYKAQLLKIKGLSIMGKDFSTYRLIAEPNNSNFITISLERERNEEFYSIAKWLSEVILVSDNEDLEPVIYRIEDIEDLSFTEYSVKPAETDETNNLLTFPKEKEKLVASGSILLRLSGPVSDKFKTSDLSRLVKLF